MSEKLTGNWDAGLAYSIHTISSEYLGEYENGRPKFDTEYSEMGELVYHLKYRGKKENVMKIVTLLDRLRGIEKFDVLIPIPATNKARPYQPVDLITAALGKRRGVEVLDDLLLNTGTTELKTVSDPLAREALLEESMSLEGGDRLAGKKVLLVDDLYRSGSTFSVATDILNSETGVDRICVLAMTKTRSNR